MALCDQLEAEQTERDHLRERTAKSTLFHLTDAPTRAEARRYWQYAEQHFPHLFDRSATVPDLRATILQLAVRGRLVPQNPDDEPASESLDQILVHRRNKWEQQIKSVYLAKGRNLPSDWTGNYKQPVTPNISDLADIPQNWIWSTLDQLAWDSSYGTSEKCDYNGAGSPVLRIPNISGKNLSLEDMKYTLKPSDWAEIAPLSAGDFLIIRTNGSSDLVGQGKLIRHDFDEPHYFASYLIRFRLLDFGSVPEWVELVWNSSYIRHWIANIAQTTAGQFNVNMTNLSKIPVPVPPTKERHQVITKVNELMALCDQLEAEADACQSLSGRLFDSIVHHLFARD